MRTSKSRIVFTAIGLLVLAVVFSWALGWFTFGLPDIDRDTIMAWVDAAGVWGPVVIIATMTLAVVASPIPSAPIALAAGAVYGHYAGALYVAIGAELGAMIAFLIARFFGQATVNRLLGAKVDYGLLGSQNALTMTVFVTRLLPFVSFDAMSYAAGLSRLHLWRFLIATLAGIIPASFVLAHFGGQAASGDFGITEWLALGLGLVTAAPILLIALRRKKSNRSETHI